MKKIIWLGLPLVIQAVGSNVVACENNNNNNNVLTKQHIAVGVSKVETKWYYFGSYYDVYLSNDLTNKIKDASEEKDGTWATTVLLNEFSQIGYHWYSVSMNFPANFLGLSTNIAIRKPWTANVGNGIQWSQAVFGTITNIWNQV